MFSQFQTKFQLYKNNELHIIELLEYSNSKEDYIELLDYIILNKKRDHSDFRFFLYYIRKFRFFDCFESVYIKLVENNLIIDSSMNFLKDYSLYCNNEEYLKIILHCFENYHLSLENEINFIKYKIESIQNINNF